MTQYRAIIDFDFHNFDGEFVERREYTLAGPYSTPAAAKGAVTKARRGWPFVFWFTPKGVPSAQRIAQQVSAPVHGVRLQVSEPVWKDYDGGE